MKRFCFLLSAILFGLAVRAQSVTYTCRYWFDMNHAQAVTTTFSENIWQVEWDVGTLTKGLHTLHVQVADTSSAWCSPLSYMFLKLSPTEPLLDTVDMSDLTYHCWFDQDDAHQQTGALGDGVFLFDVESLDDGLHSVNIMLEGSTLTSTQNYMFIKVAQQAPLIDPIDMSNLVYHCWFDQDYENHVVDSVSNGVILLDLDNITDGLHTVHVMLEGEALTSTLSYIFVKVPQTSLVEPINMNNLAYHCWFDQDYENRVTAPISNGIMLLDVDNISDGLHSVHILLEGEALTSTLTYMFLKKPEHQDFGIAKWQYFLNGEISQPHTTEFSPVIDSLDIITLLPVETWPVRSSCFHFHPNGNEPYLNAKNEVTFRFWSNDDRLIEKSAFYVDYQVQQDIVANVFERNTTETFTAPRNNQIRWYKLDAVVGDSLAFVADKACTMQLFAPSGEEVYDASGPESVTLGGLHAWEDGTYYLAVHDVTGSGDQISVTYQYVHKYAVLAYDVHLVGNGGCSTITFQGNGFNSLLDAYLVNYQNDTIHRLDIGHESNTTTTVTFNFYEVNLGVYDAVFEFYDETIRVNGALEVEEPTPILLTNSVSYPHSFMSGTPVKYSYTITNHGNMSAYKIPIFIYVSTLLSGNVEHIELEGLKLPSLIDGMSTDSLSEAEALELRQLSDRIGDLHHFFAFKSVDENTGDSIRILSNYFFLNLAPLESRDVDVIVTARTGAHNPLNVWLTVPNDTVQPLVISERGIRDQYCCVKDKIECVLNITSDISGLLSNIPGAWGVAAHITDCATSTLSTLSSSIGYWVCREEGGPSLDDLYALKDSKDSYASLIAECFKKFLSKWKLLKPILAKLDEEGSNGLETLMGIKQDIEDCVSAFTQKTPDCPPGDGEGGASDGQTPSDPNDIHGYLSESGSHYMRQEIQNVQYEIEFENDTTLATAAAHTIIVRDTLDAAKFDLNSLAARSVTIGDKRLDLNGEQTFARTLDLRPDIYVIAQVNQDYDPTTGIIQWTIQSLDPMTMEPTDNPYQGVLPVNYYGNGVGFIDYSINLKQAFADGTAISNRAGIIFDQEAVIMTPTWTNIVDAVKPTSHIENAVVEADSLHFNFVSSDNRSGVWYHALYYRNNSTEQEWQVRKPQIFGNTYMLPFDSLQTTEYLVMAIDSAGNREEKEMVAEVIVEANVNGFPFFVSGYGESEGGWKLIASPVAGSIEATTVANIFSATDYDLYYYDQGEVSEWRNYKSEPFELENGQGYLYATKEGQTLVFRGTHNVADTYEVTLAYTEDNPNPSKRGWNLIGNPFTVPAYVDRSYYTMNEDGSAIEPNAASSATAIPACNGVMVKAEAPNETVIFSKATRWNAPNQGGLQITVTQVDKNDSSAGSTIADKAIISFNPGDQLGKFDFNSNAVVYLPQGGKDYAIVSVGGDAARHVSTTEIPVNFKATENGQYTISVNPEGVEMSYLHLIDNLTGADIDLLGEFPLSKEDQGDSTPQPVTYTFTAKPTDQASRFRLVFSFCGDTGIDVKE